LPKIEEKRESQSIKVKPSIWKKAKIEAVKHDITVSQLVEDAIGEWLREHRVK
jgi:hypothetical protein